MGRKKRRRGNSGFNQQKIFGLLRKGALLAPAAVTLLGSGDAMQKAKQLCIKYLCWNPDDGSVKLERAVHGYGAWAATTLVTYGVPKIASFIRGLFR